MSACPARPTTWHADLHVTAVWLGPGLIDNLLRERAIVDIAGTTHRGRQVARGHNKKVIDRAGTPGSTGAVTVTFGIRRGGLSHLLGDCPRVAKL